MYHILSGFCIWFFPVSHLAGRTFGALSEILDKGQDFIDIQEFNNKQGFKNSRIQGKTWVQINTGASYFSVKNLGHPRLRASLNWSNNGIRQGNYIHVNFSHRNINLVAHIERGK